MGKHGNKYLVFSVDRKPKKWQGNIDGERKTTGRKKGTENYNTERIVMERDSAKYKLVLTRSPKRSGQSSWVSFDFNVSYSSCWGYSLINTLKLKHLNPRWIARTNPRACWGLTETGARPSDARIATAVSHLIGVFFSCAQFLQISRTLAETHWAHGRRHHDLATTADPSTIQTQ